MNIHYIYIYIIYTMNICISVIPVNVRNFFVVKHNCIQLFN